MHVYQQPASQKQHKCIDGGPPLIPYALFSACVLSYSHSRDGSVLSYPVVETIHKDNICHVTEAPADVPHAVAERARAAAERAVQCLEGAGIFG